MMPGGPQTAQEPDEKQQHYVVVESQAQHIMVEARAAVAARDAVIAEQAGQIEVLTARVASLSLNASLAAASAAGPAQGAAARGAAAMTTRQVGGGYHASTSMMNVMLPTNSVGSAAAASTGGWPVTGGDAELMSLPTLSPSVQKCAMSSCRARASNGVVYMTKAGQKFHTNLDCNAIRGHDVQRFVMRL
jgi:hypothetical protein